MNLLHNTLPGLLSPITVVAGRERASLQQRNWLTGILTGAATGAAAGPWGAAAGATIGLLGSAFRQQVSSWTGAGPGVHDWYTENAPQVFLDWMRANHPDQFASVQQAKYWLAVWFASASPFTSRVIMPGQTVQPYDYYDAQATPAGYGDAGIDYTASVRAQDLVPVGAGARQTAGLLLWFAAGLVGIGLIVFLHRKLKK